MKSKKSTDMLEMYNLILKSKLTPNQFYLLYYIKHGIATLYINIHAELRELSGGEWIVYDDKRWRLTPKANTLVQQVETFFKIQKKKTSMQLMGDEFLDNITAYVEIFPKKKLPSGKPARADVKNLETAFRWFFDNYSYEWDTILRATNKYVEEYELKNYKFMQTSQYFVRKQQTDKTWNSELANYCASVDSGEIDEGEDYFGEKIV